jgi:low temperature requirement protein LtrA
VVLYLGPRHPLAANFRRILGWVSIAAAFWIAGGLAQDASTRLLLWALAVACEYISPMTGFWLPGLGRSRTGDWTIEGGHLAERCQAFVIMALGESILITGATLADKAPWDAPILIAFLAAFVGSLAMWWLYFDTSSKDGSHAIAHAADPGRIGAWFHYVHVILVAGVIISAVANELVIAHPDGHMATKYLVALIAGPAVYLLGNAIYKKIVYGRFPASHVAGLLALAVLTPLGYLTDLLMVGGLTTVILIVVAAWDGCVRRASPVHPAQPA